MGERIYGGGGRYGRQHAGRAQASGAGAPDVAELRRAIEERLRGTSAFSHTSYGDQPIVFTGRQLKSYVPEPIRQARALAHGPQMAAHREPYVFWQQAKLLADFEDDYDFRGHFSRYFPTYEVMSNDQLRGYFSWRTRWRQGQADPTETSFVYVCAYELVNGIGAPTPRACYDALTRLRNDYGDEDPRMRLNLDRWLDDFVVYWGLPQELLGAFAHQEADAALAVLLAWGSHGDEELFDALAKLSSYRVLDSAFFGEYAADLRRVATRVYRAMAAHHDRDLKRSLVETYFGVSAEQDLALFANAIFADPKSYEAYDYEVSPLDHVHCRHRRWSRDRYTGNLRPNKKLGALLKTIDATMRQAYGFGHELTVPLKTKYVLGLIERETGALLAERAEAERRAIHIDVSKLGGIRAAAAVTRDRLIVDEDDVEALSPAPLHAGEKDAGGRGASRGSFAQGRVRERGLSERAARVAELHPPLGEASAELPLDLPRPSRPVSDEPDKLTEDERALLEVMLAGGSVRAFERSRHVMASLLIDSINEKLLDEVGDVVIDAGQDEPCIIEDYLDDVRATLGA